MLLSLKVKPAIIFGHYRYMYILNIRSFLHSLTNIYISEHTNAAGLSQYMVAVGNTAQPSTACSRNHFSQPPYVVTKSTSITNTATNYTYKYIRPFAEL